MRAATRSLFPLITTPEGKKPSRPSPPCLDAQSSPTGAIDGLAFLQRVEAHLNPLAPIMTFVVKKQMLDLNTSAESLTPELARRFIDRMVTVLRTFVPSTKVEEVRQVLLREFRKAAPWYSEQMIYGGK